MLFPGEWIPLKTIFVGVSPLKADGLTHDGHDLFKMMIATNGVFKAIGDHGLRSVVLPLLGSGKEKWNVTLFLWMVMFNLPLCPNLQYLRIVSRGSEGHDERGHNAVKHFLDHANNLLNNVATCRQVIRLTLRRLEMNYAAAHFNSYLTTLQVMHLRNQMQVILATSGALRVFRELIQHAEINGVTLFQACQMHTRLPTDEGNRTHQARQ